MIMLDYCQYYMFRVAGIIAPLLPSSIGYRLAAWSGWLHYHLSRRVRENFRSNMRHVLGCGADESTVDQKVREICRNLFRNHYDVLCIGALSEKDMRRLVQIEGAENVDSALAMGRGLILTSAHFGAPEFTVQLVTKYHVPLIVPTERVRPEAFYRYMCRLRAGRGHGISFIPIDGALLKLFRALKRGQAVGFTIDRDVTGSGIVLDFFDSPARLPTGHVHLALRTGAPIIVAFSIRQLDGTFSVRVEPPLLVEDTGDREQDVQRGVKKIAAIMERYITEYPEQWLISVPMWQSEHE